MKILEIGEERRIKKGRELTEKKGVAEKERERRKKMIKEEREEKSQKSRERK